MLRSASLLVQGPCIKGKKDESLEEVQHEVAEAKTVSVGIIPHVSRAPVSVASSMVMLSGGAVTSRFLFTANAHFIAGLSGQDIA